MLLWWVVYMLITVWPLRCCGDHGGGGDTVRHNTTRTVGWQQVSQMLHRKYTLTHGTGVDEEDVVLALYRTLMSASGKVVCVLPPTAQSYAVTLAAVMLYDDVPGLRHVRLNRLR